uniref:Uncharacterized protein n=1 Tax=Romanomermis culicivorax TaxID=13658 RepID=A0A915HQM9_ROMCU
MENRFISCKSCCNRNFCNVDSASVTIHVFHESSIYIMKDYVL